MSKNNTNSLTANAEKSNSLNNKKQLKSELMDVFKKFGYLSEDIDYEVTFRTTSGNIAWININSIETIK